MRWLSRLNPLEWLVALGVLATLVSLVLPADLAAVFDRNPNNTLPITKVLSRDVQIDNQTAVQIIEIARHLESSAHQRIDFVLVNNGTAPVYYYGYTRTSFEPRLNYGQLRPFYKKQIESEPGWKDKIVSRCGNGAATMCLMPGYAGNFYAIQHNDEPTIRIGVLYASSAEADEDTRLVAWSEIINLQ